ncbi:MAG: hypothetical protein IPO21_09030 [Bacteroidales bacterium]|nr:hypothetical protein [Bacteroidales bacterium]
MNLQTRKINFVQEFLRLQNEEIISGLENLLKAKKIEQYEKKLIPMSSDQFNQEIDQALLDSEEDRITSAKDIKKKFQAWD